MTRILKLWALGAFSAGFAAMAGDLAIAAGMALARGKCAAHLLADTLGLTIERTTESACINVERKHEAARSIL